MEEKNKLEKYRKQKKKIMFLLVFLFGALTASSIICVMAFHQFYGFKKGALTEALKDLKDTNYERRNFE